MLALCSKAFAAEPVAVVILATGKVEANGRALQRRSPVYVGDTIQTAENSKVQFKYRDGTQVSLQPSSRYTVKEFTFNPTTHQGEVKTGLLKGGLQTISGAISKRSSEGYKIETPWR